LLNIYNNLLLIFNIIKNVVTELSENEEDNIPTDLENKKITNEHKLQAMPDIKPPGT